VVRVTLEATVDDLVRALDAVQPGHHSERAALLNQLGEARRRAGETVYAQQAFMEAARHARSVGDAELLGDAALGYGLGAGGLHRGHRSDLQHIALLEEALSALGPVEGSLRVRLLARLAEELSFTPEATTRAALCGEAVAMARRLEDPSVLLAALHARAVGHVGPDLPAEERIEEAAELLELGDAVGEKEACYLGHMLRELALLEAGRRLEAVADLDAAERLSGELGMTSLQAWAATARARHLYLDGRLEEAEAENARAFGLALENGGDPEAANLLVGGQLLSFQILKSELSPYVPALHDLRVKNPQFTVVRCFTAYAALETGDAEHARHELADLGQQGFTDIRRNAEWPATMWALSRVAVALGDVRAAEQIYAELVSCSGRWFADWAATCMGPVDTCLGMLAALAGRHTAADRHFALAEEQARSNASPPWLADAHIAHAAALLARGGEDERAQALLVDADTQCRAMGLETLGQKARALLA
jgi:tetratricopeptide (TPR) repeat protein